MSAAVEEQQTTVVMNRSVNNPAVETLEEKSDPIQLNEGIIFNIQTPMLRYVRVKSQLAREFLAEILGTFILCIFGLASVAQNKFFKRDSAYDSSFLSVNLSFGFGVVVAILAVGKVSGAHLNPAVSFAMLLTGRMSLLRFLLYTIAQMMGAFLGALLVFLTYLDILKSYRGEMYSLDTAGIFATYPNAHLSVFGGFFDQVTGTALLIIAIMAITDKDNIEIANGTKAVIIGLVITLIGTSFAYNCGYAVNPARDLGPRLFTLIAGWGGQVFTAGNYFFWVPIVGPFVGSFIGTLLYLLFISNHWL